MRNGPKYVCAEENPAKMTFYLVWSDSMKWKATSDIENLGFSMPPSIGAWVDAQARSLHVPFVRV